MTSALSAICGTHFGLTKLVTSISFRPASCKRCTSSILTAAGTGCFSFCRPSRGPTSTSWTREGSFMGSLSRKVSVAPHGVDQAGNGIAALQREDLAGDLGDAFIAQGACRGVGRDGDFRVFPESVPGGQRLGAEHVQRGPSHVAAVQQGQQVVVDQVRATR